MNHFKLLILLGFYCCGRTQRKVNLRKKELISASDSQIIFYQGVKSGQELKAGTQRQELKHRSSRNNAYWLVPPSFLSLLSYISQDHLLSCSTVPNELGLPTSFTNQKIPHIQSIIEAFSQLIFSTQITLASLKLTKLTRTQSNLFSQPAFPGLIFLIFLKTYISYTSQQMNFNPAIWLL